MALVFRCDGCGRLEGHDQRNKWETEKAGSITIIKDLEKFSNQRDTRHEVNKDLCKLCMSALDKFLKELSETAVKKD